jgi:cobalt-zinc-cadmium efflux system membrane fusion protein
MLGLHIRSGRLLWGGVIGLAALAAASVLLVLMWPRSGESQPNVISQVETNNPLKRDGNTIIVPPEVMSALKVKTVAAAKATGPRTLTAVSACLALDNNTLARVPPRFPGEVIAMRTIKGLEATAVPDKRSGDRLLRFGDRVKKNQVLAVLWSKDVGEKKSEYVGALCQLKLDREQLDNLEKINMKQGIVPEQQIRDARTKVQGDLVAVMKAENTLRSWRMNDADLKGLQAEADNIEGLTGKDANAFERWARVEILAPQDGVIVEMNISLRTLVNDTSADLFKIADTSKLTVWASVYEDDVPLLSRLHKQKPLKWHVQLPSQPPDTFLDGDLEQIGELIDSAQHTAVIMGTVKNEDGELRAGQFVTVTIILPPAEDEIEIPTTALVEDGKDSVVFVQPDPKVAKFERRKVTVSRRFHDMVYLRGSLEPGELVVVSGSLLLHDAMNEQPENKGH